MYGVDGIVDVMVVLPQCGNTMLMCAAEGGCTKVASDLLNTGSIDINAVNEVCKVFV